MNIYSLWVNLCSIMGADVQNLYSDTSPCFYFIGVTEETILRDSAVTTCIILHVTLGRSFHSVGATRNKSYEKNKRYCVEIVVTSFTKC